MNEELKEIIRSYPKEFIRGFKAPKDKKNPYIQTFHFQLTVSDAQYIAWREGHKLMNEEKPLMPLKEFNTERAKLYQKPANPNGIACPTCGKCLIDSDPNSTLTSNPPQKKVQCPDCGYQGYRIA